MSSITPELIKTLRDRTNISIGKCKAALEEAKGDIELAIANLRKAGMASAVKKEGRETKEGVIALAETEQAITLVEVNAETDFVVKNDRFKEFVDHIVREIALATPSSLEAFLQQKYSQEPSLTIDGYRATMVQSIGENIQIRRLLTLKKTPNHSLGVYSHLGGKIITAVEIAGGADEQPLAKDIAMHVAAAAPEYLSPEQVPQEVIERERDIAKSQVQGKPAHMVEKIVDGKVNAYYDANCLIRQHYIKDDALTIEALVQRRAKEHGKPLTLVRFVYWCVGR